MAKKVFLQLTIIFWCCFISAQNRNIKYTLDPYGKKTSASFMNLAEKYPNNSMAFRITADSGRVYQFNAPRYSAYKINYTDLRKKIEGITGKTYTESTIFIIYYKYKDDVCSDRFSNNINRERMKESREYHDPLKVHIERTYANSIFLVLFEKGISISNNPQSENEYFFSDTDNRIRKTIFQNPTVCGSFSIIKHDGTTLIYNGETTADTFAGHLKPEIWNSIFKTQ